MGVTSIRLERARTVDASRAGLGRSEYVFRAGRWLAPPCCLSLQRRNKSPKVELVS
jgi:hypothetical protein